MTIPFPLAGAVLASGSWAGLEAPVWPTTMLSLTSGTGSAVWPTTMGGGGGGGSGEPEKKVAPSCLVRGLGSRWWLVLVRLATLYPGVAPRLPSVRCSLGIIRGYVDVYPVCN